MIGQINARRVDLPDRLVGGIGCRDKGFLAAPVGGAAGLVAIDCEIRAALLSHLQRLESRATATAHRIRFQYEHLRRLPPDYLGEKRVVVTRQLPSEDGRDWVEFEEVPGPDPEPPLPPGRTPDLISVMFVEAYPVEGAGHESRRGPGQNLPQVRLPIFALNARVRWCSVRRRGSVI